MGNGTCPPQPQSARCHNHFRNRSFENCPVPGLRVILFFGWISVAQAWYHWSEARRIYFPVAVSTLMFTMTEGWPQKWPTGLIADSNVKVAYLLCAGSVLSLIFFIQIFIASGPAFIYQNTYVNSERGWTNSSTEQMHHHFHCNWRVGCRDVVKRSTVTWESVFKFLISLYLFNSFDLLGLHFIVVVKLGQPEARRLWQTSTSICLSILFGSLEGWRRSQDQICSGKSLDSSDFSSEFSDLKTL